MRSVFADTSYFVALASPNDDLRPMTLAVSQKLTDVRLVTTDSVLMEFLNFFCERGENWRRTAIKLYRAINNDPNITVLPQNRSVLGKAVGLYETRCDKGYSIIDCISMTEMKARHIAEALTSDHHFEQEGFSILLK